MENRKNMTLRIGVIATFLALVTLVAISATFAKYVTEGPESSDQARVAKWGVAIAANTTATDSLFNTTYSTGEDEDAYTFAVSSDSSCIVAPGTSGSVKLGDLFTITGEPEVNTKLGLSASSLDFPLGAWTVNKGTAEAPNNVFYCPLNLKINDGTSDVVDFDASVYTAKADLISAWSTAVNTAIANLSKVYASNTDLSDADVLDDLTISWSWAFETGDTDAARAANNKLDTQLGDAAANAASENDRLFIQLGFTVSAEQTMDAPSA